MRAFFFFKKKLISVPVAYYCFIFLYTNYHHPICLFLNYYSFFENFFFWSFQIIA